MVTSRTPVTGLAIDIGSSSVKVARADLSGPQPEIAAQSEVPHHPVQKAQYLEWDIEGLVQQLIQRHALLAPPGQLLVSIDSCGDGLVFVDRHGDRVGPIRCYRDPALKPIAAMSRERGLPARVLKRTGSSIGEESTLTQLLAIQHQAPDWLDDVHHVVPLVDYLGALISGQPAGATTAGISPASSSGFLNPRTGQVDRQLLNELGIPQTWIPQPVREMVIAEDVLPNLLPPRIRASVAKIAGHDTATALLADSRRAPGRAYVSLGSWAVVGVVIEEHQRATAPFPGLDPIMYEATGEGRLRVNRNVSALRLLQQLEHEWFDRPTTAERQQLLPRPEPWNNTAIIPLDTLDVTYPLESQLQRFASRAGQRRLDRRQLVHELLRAIAQAIADTVGALDRLGLTDPAAGLWIAGGGVRISALTAWISELTGRQVDLGPANASAAGAIRGIAALTRTTAYDAATADRP